jgi:hypothetical protein
MDFKGRERTAYHEAGHAVIGYRFGLRWGDVGIKATKERTGSIRRWFEVIDIKRRILVLLAGHAAIMAFEPAYKGLPSMSDYREVWRLCDSISMSAEDYHKLFIELDALVAENSKQIQAVAEALMECDTLDSGLFSHIIELVDEGKDWRQSTTWIVHKQFAPRQKSDSETCSFDTPWQKGDATG